MDDKVRFYVVLGIGSACVWLMGTMATLSDRAQLESNPVGFLLGAATFAIGHKLYQRSRRPKAPKAAPAELFAAADGPLSREELLAVVRAALPLLPPSPALVVVRLEPFQLSNGKQSYRTKLEGAPRGKMSDALLSAVDACAVTMRKKGGLVSGRVYGSVENGAVVSVSFELTD